MHTSGSPSTVLHPRKIPNHSYHLECQGLHIIYCVLVPNHYVARFAGDAILHFPRNTVSTSIYDVIWGVWSCLVHH